MDEFPTIDRLFKFLSDDPQWHELMQIHEKLYITIDKLLNELNSYVYKYQEEDIPDYRHYLCIFLFRTMRISHSINHLCIYGLNNEATMLRRPLLENIVNTKVFISHLEKEGRGRYMRQIRLFELINEKKMHKKRIIDEQTNKEHGITTRYIAEADQNMQECLNTGLQRYNKKEIRKVYEDVHNNIGWHGMKTCDAFKECNMESDYNLTYQTACTLLHVRETFPFYSSNDERELISKMQMNLMFGTIISHLNDFNGECSEAFNKYNLNELINNIKKRNLLLHYQLCKEYDPKLLEMVSTSSSS